MTNDELDQKWREAQARMKAMKDEEKKKTTLCSSLKGGESDVG